MAGHRPVVYGTIRRKFCERTNWRHHVNHTGKKGLYSGNFCKVGKLIYPASAHLGLLRTRTCLSAGCFRVTPRFVLSHIARHRFPHRPRHLNWSDWGSITPPHSGQMQLRMADRTFSLVGLELCDHIRFLQSTEIPGLQDRLTAGSHRSATS